MSLYDLNHVGHTEKHEMIHNIMMVKISRFCVYNVFRCHNICVEAYRVIIVLLTNLVMFHVMVSIEYGVLVLYGTITKVIVKTQTQKLRFFLM